MINFLSKYKFIFHLANIVLIFIYLFPGSMFGCILYNDCFVQPQLTPDFIVSSNHLYAFLILSIIGVNTFKNSKYLNFLLIYLILISVFLEVFHLIIPNRSFELSDLFGNLAGVVIVIIIHFFFNYEKFKN
jgi:VanZ family protein